MSLKSILMALQDDDRYAGLGELPENPVAPMPMPTLQPQQQQGNGLMSLLPLLMSQQQGRGPGGGNPGAGGPGMPGAGGPPRQLALEIARRLERKGFQVGGLEGFQGTDPTITSGHIDNSQHYSGMAGDVTYGGSGRWGNQDAALDWVERMLQRRYGNSITELIWQEPDHYGHLHYGTRPGG